MEKQDSKMTHVILKDFQELKGGSWSLALIGNTIFVAVLYGVWLLSFKS